MGRGEGGGGRAEERLKVKYLRKKMSVEEYEMKAREEQMLKRSFLAIFTGLLCSHLLCIVNHCKSLGDFLPRSNRMIVQVLALSGTLRP